MERRTINLKATKTVWERLEAVTAYNRIRGEGPSTKQALVTAYIEQGLDREFPAAERALKSVRG